MITLIISLSVVFTGCSKEDDNTLVDTSKTKNNEISEKETKEESVDITWIIRTTPQKDMDKVVEKMNQILKEKINIKLNLVAIDPGVYNETMRMKLATGEDFDICFSANWVNDFYGNVARDAFLPLNDLLKKYSPQTYKMIPEDFWGAVTINGEIYGVPNYQIVANQRGIIIHKDIVDKYQFDINSIKKLEDVEPLLAKIEKGEPKNVIPFLNYKDGKWAEMNNYYGIIVIGERSLPGVIKKDDDSFTVINQYESPEFIEHINLMRDWYQKGYISIDSATLTDILAIMKSGNTPVIYTDMKPGGKAEMEKLLGYKEIVEIPLETPTVSTANISATLQAINKNSKHPVESMHLIELINNDKELYNLMCFGIENVHYKKVADNRIEPIGNSGYAPNKAWSYGNQFNAYLVPGQEDDIWEDTVKLNNSVEASKLLGFVFDAEPIKAEMAQCKSVVDEFGPGLWTGTIDIDQYYDQFIEKLKAVGSEKIIAEKQKQLNEWRTANNK